MNTQEKYYNDLVARSCRGNAVPIRDYREEKTARERVMERRRRSRINIKKALISGIIAGAILTSGIGVTVDKVIPAIGDQLQVTQEIGNESYGFEEEYVVPNAHRTQDANHYLWYDYQEIAKGLLEYGDKDFDKNLYYCLEVMDSKNVDAVLGLVEDKDHDYSYGVMDADGNYQSRNFRHYLAVNNYYDPDINVTDEVLLNDDEAYEDAIRNFKKTMKARIGIEQDFSEAEKNYNQKQAELEEMMEEHNMDGPQDKGIRR